MRTEAVFGSIYQFCRSKMVWSYQSAAAFSLTKSTQYCGRHCDCQETSPVRDAALGAPVTQTSPHRYSDKAGSSADKHLEADQNTSLHIVFSDMTRNTSRIKQWEQHDAWLNT
jgi:hypothetical protein